MMVAVAQEPGYARMVGHEFVQRYYHKLLHSPGAVHKYYKDVSMICRPEDDGSMSVTTTMKAINHKIMSLKYDKYVKVVLKSMDAHSFSSGFQVRVIGSLIGKKDGIPQSFSQSFFLEQQERGWYFVLDDVFRFADNVNFHDGNMGSASDVEDVVSGVEDAVGDVEDASCHDGNKGLVRDVEDAVSDMEDAVSDVEQANSHDGNMGSVEDSVSDVEEEALCTTPMQADFGELQDGSDIDVELEPDIKTEDVPKRSYSFPVTGVEPAFTPRSSGSGSIEGRWCDVVSKKSNSKRVSVLDKRALEEDEKASQSRKMSRKENESIVNIDTIDLHGKTVKQARRIVKQQLKSLSSSSSVRFLKVITGRGLHSEGGVPMIKPAVIKILEKEQLVWKGENKGGALVITVDGEREFNFSSSDSDTGPRPRPRPHKLSDYGL